MIIYKVTNTINNKIYIGQTKRKLGQRRSNHLYYAKKNNDTVFARALNKYGKDIFKWEVIDTADNQEEINIKEKYYIKYYKSLVTENGYNVSKGGYDGERIDGYGDFLSEVKGTEKFLVYKTTGEYVGYWPNKARCERDLNININTINDLRRNDFCFGMGYLFINKSYHEKISNDKNWFENIIKNKKWGSHKYFWDVIQVFDRYTGEFLMESDKIKNITDKFNVSSSDIYKALDKKDLHGQLFFKLKKDKVKFTTKSLYDVYDINDNFLGTFKTTAKVGIFLNISQSAVHSQLNKTKKVKGKRYIIKTRQKTLII